MMGWLVSEGRVLASVDVADTRSARRRGLLGRDRSEVEGAIFLPHTRWVHTIGMRFAIDVAYLAEDGTVVRVAHMHRNRVGRPVSGAHDVVEAAAGAFERWEVHPGIRIELRP